MAKAARHAAACDCSGLAVEWDAIEPVRDSLRAGALVPEDTGTDDIKSAVAIDQVLRPVLKRCLAADSRIPYVEPLRAEVEKAYVKNQQQPAASTIEHDAEVIKKLCTFIKMKCRRVEVSLVAWLCCYL